MSLLSFASGLRDQTTIIPSGSWRGNQSGGAFYFGMGPGGADLYVDDANNRAWYWNAYRFCPTVATVVNRKAEAYINGDTSIMTRSGQGKGKESNNDNAKKLKALMSKPNPLQSWSQFEAQYYTYYQVYGFCIILPIRPVGYNNPIDTTRLWIIPPALVDIEESQKLWYTNDGKTLIKSITLTLGSEKTTLNWDDLIILKDFVPSYSSLIIPESRLQALKRPIETVIKGYRAMCNGFDNTPLGIIGNDSKDNMSFIPIDPEEKKRIQMELRGHGLGDRQNKFILSDAALTWNPINYPIDSLKIPEHTQVAVYAICDGLGYPPNLLSNDPATFNNRRESRKDLYENFIVPTSKSIYEQWNQYFKTEELNLLIENDYSHLPVMQQDALQKAQARKAGNDAYLIEFQNDLITVNRWLELNGEETRGAEGEIYYSDWIKTHPEMLAPRYTVGFTSTSSTSNTSSSNNNN